ncbi:NYN domain-containing protein [bacterium]|nr:NYN domain-containing protein [bacterium]
MAKHVIVDGFNIIRRDNELSRIEQINFLGAQDTLVQKMAAYRRGTSNKVTIVYDGANSENSFRQNSQKNGINVIYSAQGETADDVIVDMVARDAHQRSRYLVVTADRDLGSACRRHGVVVLPPEELLRKSQAGEPPLRNPDTWHGKREEQGWVGHTKKKGNPRKAPKNKRKTKGLW